MEVRRWAEGAFDSANASWQTAPSPPHGRCKRWPTAVENQHQVLHFRTDYRDGRLHSGIMVVVGGRIDGWSPLRTTMLLTNPSPLSRGTRSSQMLSEPSG